MRIFVTGANGFVGRHLVEHLIEVGHGVTAGVRSAGDAPPGSSEAVTRDIGTDTDWSNVLIGHDAVIHLAARVHVMNDKSADPLEEFRRVNTVGTERLAWAAAEQSVSRLVFLSSIKVNGEFTEESAFSTGDIPNPQDPYGVSKHEAEVKLRSVERETGLDVVIVRTPLVYGPHVGGNFVKMLLLAERGIPLPLGSVRNRRTMASIWNLSDLLEKGAADPEAASALILAGDGFSPSTAQLVQEMSNSMGKKDRVFRFPPALLRLAGKVTRRTAVIQRLAGSLEVQPGSSSINWTWEPPYEFRESIRRTSAWYLSGE